MASHDASIVVARIEIKLGVDLGAAELVEEVCDEGDLVPILSSDLVEVPEVYAKWQGTILLLEKRTGVPAGDCNDQMNPLLSMSSRNL